MYGKKHAFLETYGKIADTIVLSIFWILLCLPVVTVIPASAALYHCVVKNLRRERGNLTAVFWKSFRENLRQGIILNLLAAVYGIIAVSWLLFAGQFDIASAEGMVYRIVSRILLIAGMLAQVYLCPVLSRFQGNVKEVLLGAVYMSYRYLATSLCALILAVGMLYAVYVMPVSILFVPVLYMYFLSLLIEKNLKRFVEGMNKMETDPWYLE